MDSTALIKLSGAALNNDLWSSNVFKDHHVLFMAAPQTSVWAYTSSFDFVSTTHSSRGDILRPLRFVSRESVQQSRGSYAPFEQCFASLSSTICSSLEVIPFYLSQKAGGALCTGPLVGFFPHGWTWSFIALASINHMMARSWPDAWRWLSEVVIDGIGSFSSFILFIYAKRRCSEYNMIIDHGDLGGERAQLFPVLLE